MDMAAILKMRFFTDGTLFERGTQSNIFSQHNNQQNEINTPNILDLVVK